MTVNVLEIRNYLLKPNVLEHFIDYFEEHFIASQEAEHMTLLGQFRVIDEPDHFVWIRGFQDMPTRQKALQNFYGGSVWAKYGLLANEMMLEWHNVHLLRPLSDIDLTNGMTTERIAADLAAGTISLKTGLIAIDFYQLPTEQREATQANIEQAYQEKGIQIRGQFVAEMSENTFARLPVYQYDDVFVVISAYESHVAAVKRDRAIQNLAEDHILLHPNANSLLLSPTLRSPLRYS
jgi:hypothetical protein